MDQIKPEQTQHPGAWVKGAEALANFQSAHTGVAKGGKVVGGPRSGSKYATLSDILSVASEGASHGLSHSGQARMLGTDLLIWREYLHHTSGESIFSEHPIFIPSAGHSGQRQQEMGGGITYARKYCIQALYGLYADDGMDPDAISYADKAETPKAVAKPISPPERQSSVVLPPGEEVPLDRPITDDEKAEAVRILKSDPKFKAAFMARFYPSASKMMPSMLKTFEHYYFLDAQEVASKIPF